MNDLNFGFRQLWKNLGFAFVVVLALAASTVARAQEETEHVDRTLAFPSGGTLQLHNFSGAVHITGTAEKDLVIKAVRHPVAAHVAQGRPQPGVRRGPRRRR